MNGRRVCVRLVLVAVNLTFWVCLQIRPQVLLHWGCITTDLALLNRMPNRHLDKKHPVKNKNLQGIQEKPSKRSCAHTRFSVASANAALCMGAGTDMGSVCPCPAAAFIDSMIVSSVLPRENGP